MTERPLPAPVVIDPARNRRVAAYVVTGFCVMLGASFAAVPLYDLFCRVTGYGGTTMVASRAPDRVTERVFTIRFDANVASGLNWRFEPEVPEITIRAGEVKTVSYTLRNPGTQPTTGIASYNVTPDQTGAYFNKIACFCFTEQTLQPGEARTEEVVFFVDPDIAKNRELDNIRTITLSYTFFPSKNPVKPVADAGQLTAPPAPAGGTVSK
ncbi:cytochrome c oxidase assembly protein [Rhabdaerophilum sp. SD176]|uniref:cytochrome c oxidase assembly protein n=1 Tax=Rhabdaerophilum sp. SD176 TaxID=2983548 RepID=UPI0024E02D75|nr:cytochrome c oxidase assembly protein [Rhabdaerophilum sp. SD176]